MTQVKTWAVSQHEDNKETVIRDKNGYIIANLECDFFGDAKEHSEEIQQTARIMAAAPKMLEYLTDLLQYSQPPNKKDVFSYAMYIRIKDDIKRLKDFIYPVEPAMKEETL